jgi:AhpD family alkylhydroperoxidase
MAPFQKKYKELIAIAVALTTQCPYCIGLHAEAARKAGAGDEELAEASFVAAALRAGGVLSSRSHEGARMIWYTLRFATRTRDCSEGAPTL